MLKARILLLLTLFVSSCLGQRTYKASSVLSSGNWFKIGTTQAGVYKLDMALLKNLGLNADGIPSSSLRVYGNGGQMLPESCSATIIDDLQEVAIEVVDGGDGIFNSQDYLLFYAPGPDKWEKDSLNQRFIHQKNIYSDQSLYFITTGGSGKRILIQNTNLTPVQSVTTYSERYYHELDSINFLSSGKEWYGEEFSNNPGHSLNRSFTIPLTELVSGEPATIVSDCIARSVGSASRFSVSINNLPVIQQDIAAVGSSNTELFAGSSQSMANFVSTNTLNVNYNYAPKAAGAQGWLNWFEVFARRKLLLSAGTQLLFRDWNSVGPGLTAEFVLQQPAPETTVWDITETATPIKMKSSLKNGELRFVNDCGILHEYVSFGNAAYLQPAALGKVDNQDLHASPAPDMIIITHPSIISEARRLASYHAQHNNLKVSVVSSSQVYNEFSSGAPDPAAIRNFVKMYYDRAGQDTSKSPKYLLLFGDASYDYKNRIQNNSNFVPAYQSRLSLDPLATFTSDDYFGFLDDNEDINALQAGNSLDIGIGRVPAKNIAEAASYVDKVMNYSKPAALGAWRNQLTFIADDEDYNLHFHDAEVVTSAAAATNSAFIENKLYLDAFQQESNASGSRYPAINQAINENIEAGTLIWNYSGHGGFSRLAEEVVLDGQIVQSWNNVNRLPLFITATCDFAPYDNPALNSLGENILLRPKTGAIALMTTTRLVFAYSNRIMNRNYLLTALKQKSDGSYLSLGEAVKTTKNITLQSGGDIINNLKFTLLGDPALTLNYPRFNVQTTSITDGSGPARTDTLNALREYTITGMVTDQNGNTLSDFNGSVYPVIYDKPGTQTTRGNDPVSIPENFYVQQTVLFRGKATVQNGKFAFNFLVPKDIVYQYGKGRISYYAENGVTDANGSFSDFVIGGSQAVSADKTGPSIRAFLDNENFIDGMQTGPAPMLMARLADSSGINITGSAIGHDITAILDGDPEKVWVLNDYFQSSQNSYRDGVINFRLPAMAPGAHTLKLKAWDAVNNSSEAAVNFRVADNLPVTIFHVSAFPNPVGSKTTFRIDHDIPNGPIGVIVRIFTYSGMLVKSIEQTINANGGRSSDIDWDGKTDSGASIRRGVYVYTVTVKAASGVKSQASGKLVKQ